MAYLALQRKLEGPNQGPFQSRSQSPSASSDSVTPTQTARRGWVFFTISFNNPIYLAASYSILNLDLVDISFFLFFFFSVLRSFQDFNSHFLHAFNFREIRVYRKQR